MAQTIQIESDDESEKLEENEINIFVPKIDENKVCTKNKVKAITNIYGESDINFYDFGYDLEKYPSQNIKKEIPSMISTTMFSTFKKNFLDGVVDPDKPLKLFFLYYP